jgi:hypothetical protein
MVLLLGTWSVEDDGLGGGAFSLSVEDDGSWLEDFKGGDEGSGCEGSV